MLSFQMAFLKKGCSAACDVLPSAAGIGST